MPLKARAVHTITSTAAAESYIYRYICVRVQVQPSSPVCTYDTFHVCRYLCSTWIIVCSPAFFGDGSTFRCFDWLVDDGNIQTKNVQNHLFRSGMYDVCSLLACVRVWFFTCTLYQREFGKFASTAVYLVQDNTTLWPRRFDTFRPTAGLSPIPLLQLVPIHFKQLVISPSGRRKSKFTLFFR